MPTLITPVSPAQLRAGQCLYVGQFSAIADPISGSVFGDPQQPWREVMALKGLATTRARWCPQCFAEDLAESRDPYFRLGWDIGAVTACYRHRVVLADTCPDCGRVGTRHKGTYVVPGWCCHCGSFLGTGEAGCRPASPEELWTARQVGLLLAEQGSLTQTPSRQFWRDAVVEVISRMDSGKSAVFARRVGLSKSTLHHWLQQDGIPTLAGSLAIAAHAGLALPAMLRGDLSGWTPPQMGQLELPLSTKGHDRRGTPRHLDWNEIRMRLTEFAHSPNPISVSEAGRCLEVDARHLYLRANREARVLGERWKAHLRMNAEARQAHARPYVEAACRAVLDEGRAISLRELETRVPKPILASVDSLFDMVDEVRATIHRQS
ncbi:TniQ family protein [Niveibacterium microcysteis]|uniref:TniQ family protein n=1 Tax=Niveibacterium microcysteis TaxID=2811415 RepID=A0ABX7MA09_9RHOO|nr:TniQ family protein [Niveibacterium microcysteis]